LIAKIHKKESPLNNGFRGDSFYDDFGQSRFAMHKKTAGIWPAVFD